MPRANPNGSFDAAARHLLRYLDDPAMLRCNPLVRAVFADGTGRMARAREDAALASIRALVVEGAEKTYLADLAAGKHERAHRQREIVRRAYFQRTPAREVAEALGLSVRQYRRDRNDVARRIAQYVEERRNRVLAPVVFVRLDALRLRIEHAAHLTEVGDAAGAADIHEAVVRDAPSATAKIESMCRLAETWSDIGDARAAKAYLCDAEAVLERDAYELSPLAREAARCDAAFVRSVLAWRSGETREADDALSCAIQRVESIVDNGGFRVRALFAEVLLEHAQRCADRGDFPAGIASVDHVGTILGGVRDVSLRQRSDAVRIKALLAMTCGESLLSPFDAFAPMGEALALARSCGSARRVVLANAALSVLHRYGNASGLAYAAVVRSVEMMRLVAPTRFRSAVAPTLAEALSRTRHSRRGAEIVAEAAGSSPVGCMDWIRARLAHAEHLLELGQAEKSYEAALRCERYARAALAPRRRAEAMLWLALSAYGLGRAAAAREHLRIATELAERSGSWLSRCYLAEAACTVAGAACGSPRKERRARGRQPPWPSVSVQGVAR